VERRDIEAALVFVVAMGCQGAIAQSSIDAEADNQPVPHAEIESYFKNRADGRGSQARVLQQRSRIFEAPTAVFPGSIGTLCATYLGALGFAKSAPLSWS
jgi:hypothetical protein